MNATTKTVRLLRSFGDTPTPIEGLYTATSEPPICGESTVLDAHGNVLAEALRVGEHYCWQFTLPGRSVLDREVRAS